MAGGAEVGTGHISIFPVMNGFRNAVNKEMKNAGKTGSKTFDKAFGTGKKIGSRFGTSFKNGFKGSADQQLADDVLKPFKKDVAQATSKASAALLNYKQSTVAVAAPRTNSTPPSRNTVPTAPRPRPQPSRSNKPSSVKPMH